MNYSKIRNYKVLLEIIHTKLIRNNVAISKDKLDIFLKDFAGLEGSSTAMSNDELSDLIEASYLFCEQIGESIENPNDKLDKLINLNFER